MTNGKHPDGRAGYGSSYDRRARRAFLVAKHGSPSGKTIRCFHCKRPCRTSTPKRPTGTWVIDRFPVCGHLGGTYRRDNIVPSCVKCNARRCHPCSRDCKKRLERWRRKRQASDYANGVAA